MISEVVYLGHDDDIALAFSTAPAGTSTYTQLDFVNVTRVMVSLFSSARTIAATVDTGLGGLHAASISWSGGSGVLTMSLGRVFEALEVSPGTYNASVVVIDGSGDENVLAHPKSKNANLSIVVATGVEV